MLCSSGSAGAWSPDELMDPLMMIALEILEGYMKALRSAVPIFMLHPASCILQTHISYSTLQAVHYRTTRSRVP